LSLLFYVITLELTSVDDVPRAAPVDGVLCVLALEAVLVRVAAVDDPDDERKEEWK
jgi:hypothetical protein